MGASTDFGCRFGRYILQSAVCIKCRPSTFSRKFYDQYIPFSGFHVSSQLSGWYHRRIHKCTVGTLAGVFLKFSFFSGRVCRSAIFNPIPSGLWYIAIVANNGVARKVKHENTSASAGCSSPGSGLQWLRALLLQRSVLSTVRLLPIQSASRVLRAGALCWLWLLPWLLSALPRQVVIYGSNVSQSLRIALTGACL